MRIRSKLVLLVGVPLIALTLVAGFGFINQRAVIDNAAEAQTSVAEARAVQQAVMAVGNERLQRIVAGPDGLAVAAEATDASLINLNSIAVADSPVATTTVRAAALVSDARLSNDGIALEQYRSAIGSLLSLPVGSSDQYPTAAAGMSAMATRTAVRALEQQEDAWVAYLGLEGLNPAANTDLVTAVFSEFAVAETTLRQAVSLAGAESVDEYNAVLQSDAAVALNDRKTEALDDLTEGSVSVTSDQVLTDLIAFRAQWSETVDGQSGALQRLVDDRLSAAKNLRLLFTLLAVLASVILAALAVALHRAKSGPLQSVVALATSASEVELPALMSGLRRGDSMDDLPAAKPIPVTTTDEIGELVAAFNDIQTTAYELAREQAAVRKNVADMFVNLGRRNQQLLQRILGQLTEMEQHEEDPDKLAELFELDNIVTRMRRNAESLLALAGAQTARQWSQPIGIENTIRAAFGEVEGYKRVDVAMLDNTMVAGRVVADITHLIAELLENAINFSEPSTTVEVNGKNVTGGYLITVTDEGIGMSQRELIDNNNRITDPPPLDQVPTRFLGMYVVGRLAERHGIEVRLTDGHLQGTTARVLLPTELLQAADEPVGDSDGSVGDSDEPVSDSDESVGDSDEPAPEYVSEETLTMTPTSSPLEEKHDLEAELAALNGQLDPTPSQEEASSDWAGLPVRNRGDALATSGEPESLKPVARERAPTETSEAAASDFSSMLSAFSSGINQGLEASEEDATKGEDS